MRMPPWPADATMARWLRALPRLAAVLAVTVGAMALAGWALRLPLLTRLAPALPALVPNNPVAFVLVGLALVLLDADRRGGHRPAMVLVPLSASVAFIALLGYVYQVRYLYQVATGTGMALQTAATFLMLNGGLLGCRPGREPTRTFIASSPGGLLARRLVPA